MSSGSADDMHAAPDLISTMHEIARTQLTLAQPRDVVWSSFRDIRAWYTEYSWDVVSGPGYELAMGLAEGQVLQVFSSHPFPRTDGTDSPAEKLVVRVVEVDEPNRIVVMLSGRAVFDYERFTGFYVWSVGEGDDGTTVTIDGFFEADLQTPLSPAALAEYKQALAVNWHRSWTTALENLRRRLAGEGTREGI